MEVFSSISGIGKTVPRVSDFSLEADVFNALFDMFALFLSEEFRCGFPGTEIFCLSAPCVTGQPFFAQLSFVFDELAALIGEPIIAWSGWPSPNCISRCGVYS